MTLDALSFMLRFVSKFVSNFVLKTDGRTNQRTEWLRVMTQPSLKKHVLGKWITHQLCFSMSWPIPVQKVLDHRPEQSRTEKWLIHKTPTQEK